MLAVTTDVNGVGGTMNGNALALAAMRATLESVVTQTAFDHMIALGNGFTKASSEAFVTREYPGTQSV
jgi:glutamate-1-semialdehyde aminotransferase